MTFRRTRWCRLWHRWLGPRTAGEATRPRSRRPATASSPVVRYSAPHRARDLIPQPARAQIIAEYHTETTRLARAATIDLIRSGYHLGPPPYGYRAVRAAGHRARRLVPEPNTAAAVPTIFSLRVDDRLSLGAIVDRLIADPERFPAPIDRVSAQPRSWNVDLVRTILTNPAYTGRTVWGRTRHGRPVPAPRWITSARGAHRALITDRTFARTSATFTASTTTDHGVAA